MSNPSCNCSIAVDKLLFSLRWTALIGWLLVAAPSVAGVERPPNKPEVTLSLDTNFLPIGGQTTLTLQTIRLLTQPDGFTWPQFPGDTLTGGLEILESLGSDTTLVENEDGTDAIAISQKWRVTIWDTGFVAIPPVPVVWRQDTLESNPLLLQVGTPRIENPDMIAGPADVIVVEWTLAERLQLALPWILGILAVAAAVAGGLFWWRRREQKPVVEKKIEVPLEPAHVVALRELERIRERATWRTGDEKGHHAATSWAIRAYVERRFGLPALERTTVEIRRGAQGLPIRDEDRVVLLELLEVTDLVKFAKYRAPLEEHEAVVTRAIRFVESTLETGGESSAS